MSKSKIKDAVTESNLDAPVAEMENSAPVAKPFAFKVKTRISENQIKLKVGEPVYVKFDSKFYKGKQLEDKKEPATLAQVTDLETGENAIIVVPVVVQSSIEEKYSDGAYVGLCFSIEKLEKANPDKKYFPYAVAEIEVE
jgi:hypothetical protein